MVEVDRLGDQARRFVEKAVQVRVLFRLHQAQVTCGQFDCPEARHAAEHGRGEVGVAGPTQDARVFLTRDSVEDNTGYAYVGAMAQKALDHRRRGCAHAQGIDDEQDRHDEQAGQIGARAAAVGRTIEQAHDALADDHVAVLGLLVEQAGDRVEAHGPAIEIDADALAGRRVKGRIDVVRADLERAYRDAALLQGAQQAERDDGLAAARGGGGDDQATGAHRRGPPACGNDVVNCMSVF